MSHANPKVPERYTPDREWARTDEQQKRPATMNVDETEPERRVLYGPSGEVLFTISDRPPIGFHQGSRRR